MLVVLNFLECFGAACLVLAPLTFAISLIVLMRLGKVISEKDALLWGEMRPGMYSDIGVSRDHRKRLATFLSSGEYLKFNDQRLVRLARMYRVLNITSAVFLCGGVAVVIWSLS